MTGDSRDAPLVVTARLDAESFLVLDGLRRRHFPSHLNKVPAHLSLFHHLPGHEVEAVVSTLAERCRTLAPINLQPLAARRLGRGVAFAYASPNLAALHRELAGAWRDWLTPQDRQPFRPHITIQNKADPAAAAALYDTLANEPPPPCRIDGVSVHRYLGGPWEPVTSCAFAAASGRRG